MSQHDFNIANQGFPAFRTDLNSALVALATNSSGATEPATTYAWQWWFDTTLSVLKYRNAANTDWVVFDPGVADGAITAAKIAASAVTTAKIAASAVTLDKFVKSGTSGQVLTSSGSGVAPAWADAASGGIDWQSSIVTGSTLAAVANRGYWIDTTSNACTVTLPASASVGDTLIFVDYARTWATNNLTISQNSLNFQGFTSPAPVYDTDGQSVTIVYSGAAKGWTPTVDDSVTDEVPQVTAIDFLVIAGGGGGGAGANSGGAGAGGYRTSTQSVAGATSITITVGDGGAAVGSGIGNSGSNSSISGSGLTTITSAGGGGGANAGANVGLTGGSGGGGGNGGAGGAGNTPSTSPSQGNTGGTGVNTAAAYGGGGGGGAGAVGGDGTGSNGGNGGDGTASSITGSSVTRGGGGAGGTETGVGTGGAGGGGGSVHTGTAGSGTVNTGGGGGASDDAPGAGGKGVVILSMLDAKYSGTTTGSPTVATGVSGKTVLTFTGTGSYTT